jgi:hypothetical protein
MTRRVCLAGHQQRAALCRRGGSASGERALLPASSITRSPPRCSSRKGLRLGAGGGVARRLLLACFVIERRLEGPNTLSLEGQRWGDEAIDLLLGEAPVALSRATALLVK